MLSKRYGDRSVHEIGYSLTESRARIVALIPFVAGAASGGMTIEIDYRQDNYALLPHWYWARCVDPFRSARNPANQGWDKSLTCELRLERRTITMPCLLSLQAQTRTFGTQATPRFPI